LTDTSSPRWRLRSPELLRTLMKNTGDGTRTSVRDLAAHAGCHFSHIGELLTGEQETASYNHAIGICRRLGVDLLVLWAPAERTDAAVRRVPLPQKASV
jgi:hypothetical protein